MNNSNINIHNYEAYFLDYHEGTLSLDLVKELMEFLSQHPELKEEFENFEPITLNDLGAIKYEGKEALKKEAKGVNPSNFDMYAVEYVEGTLLIAMQEELGTFISRNPQYKKELELYAKTKLVPDTTIVFDDKPSLKKQTKRPVAWYYWSAAASVALIIGMYFMFNKNGSLGGNNIVKHTAVKDSNTVAHQTTKAMDTITLVKKTAHIPVNKRVKNNRMVAKVQQAKQNKNEKIVPNNIKKDSTIVVVDKGTTKNRISPVIKQNPVPVHSGIDSFAFNRQLPDTSSIGEPLIIIRAPKPEVAKVEMSARKKRGKFLVFLATITCKGLHNVTGQHIELEKHYASDTSTIVAYQLDLGNKKIEFPVKE